MLGTRFRCDAVVVDPGVRVRGGRLGAALPAATRLDRTVCESRPERFGPNASSQTTVFSSCAYCRLTRSASVGKHGMPGGRKHCHLWRSGWCLRGEVHSPRVCAVVLRLLFHLVGVSQSTPRETNQSREHCVFHFRSILTTLQLPASTSQ